MGAGVKLPAAVAFFALVASAQGQAVFRWLAPYADDTGTHASGISADGSVVVGASYGNTNRAVYWKSAGPAQWLGVLDPENTMCAALAASADGSVIVGFAASHPANSYASQTFRWTAATGMVGLGDAPAAVLVNQAWGVSGDGRVVVGQYHSTAPASGEADAFVWTQSTGFTTLPALMPQYKSYNKALAVSADGSVVVGSCGYGGPFRWTAAGGIGSLYGLQMNGLARATAISADGRIIVGDNGGEAFLWQEGAGVKWLGVPPDKDWSWANDVSDDGRVVVGVAEYEGRPTEAIVWTADRGMRYLREVLASDFGLNIPPEALLEATGISADGRVITGNGGALGAWVVTIPEPSALLLVVSCCCVALRRGHQKHEPAAAT